MRGHRGSKDLVYFRALSENSLAGEYAVQDGQTLYVNPSLARMFGYSPTELVGQGLGGDVEVGLLASDRGLRALVGEPCLLVLLRRDHLGGQHLVARYGKRVGVTSAKLKQVERFFDRHGDVVIIFARFVVLLRQLNGIVAGTLSMSWPRFLLFNAIGAALWVGVWSAIGYFGGSHIETFLRYQLYVTIAVVAALIVFIAHKLLKRAKPQNNT